MVAITGRCFELYLSRILRPDGRRTRPAPAQLRQWRSRQSPQKFLPPDPLPFCPPAWASPLIFLGWLAAGNTQMTRHFLSDFL